MYNLITGRYDNNKIGSLTIEVTTDENHSFMNEVTDYPVEEGFNISDHVYKRPEELTISGIFSETPIPNETDDLTLNLAGEGESRIQNALEDLLAIAGYTLPKQSSSPSESGRPLEIVPQKTLNPKIVDIVTTLRIYTDMVCTSITIPVSRQTGQSLNFTAKFKKIRTVESKIVSIDRTSDLNGKAPNVKQQAPKPKPVGKQSTEEVTQDGILLKGVRFAVRKIRGLGGR